MKNKSIINRLLICLSIIVLCSISILWLFETSNHLYYLLTLCGLVIISIGIAIWYLQKDSQPILIDLTNTSSKVLQNLFLATIILLSIYVIPFDYFIISALLIIASMIVPAFFQKSFAISSKGIRCVFKWNLKWEDIDSYSLNEKNGILNIQLKNGENKQVIGIKRKYYSDIKTEIGKYFKVKNQII